MANRVVSPKEVREDFRKECLVIADFSQKKSKHILGAGPKQMNIDVGVEIIRALKARYEADGRVLDKELVDLHTPRGERRYASSQINSLASPRLVRGANPVETLYRSLGDLIIVTRKGRQNICVAKNGATEMEVMSYLNLRGGKVDAAVRANEEFTSEVLRGVDKLDGRTIGQAYAEDCVETFKALKAA